MEDVVLSWSGGKDCALALHEVRTRGELDVRYLLTTVTEGYDRVSMHGVRRALLERQARALGIDLFDIAIPKDVSNEVYDRIMEDALGKLRAEGLRKVVFGDIFLEDVRSYRERNLSRIGMEALFPLWGRDTSRLARRFLDLGFKAVVTCVDREQLDMDLAGRTLEPSFFEDLPEGVDPCGENGEFHTFVFDGPLFKERVGFELGERVLREERFQYIDLVEER